MMTVAQIEAELAQLEAFIERPRDLTYMAGLELRQAKQRREHLQNALRDVDEQQLRTNKKEK
jgi:hypothetical protein